MTYIPPSVRHIDSKVSEQWPSPEPTDKKNRHLSIEIPNIEYNFPDRSEPIAPTSNNRVRPPLGLPIKDSMESWNGELPYANCDIESPLRRTKKSMQLKY